MTPQVYKDSIKVGIAEPRPTHDISLTDNKGNTVGLILTNRQGVRDPKGLLEGSMPRTALRTSQGNVGYDDLELPFTAEVQNTMVGGRAQEEFARDRTKYSDGFRMDTTKEFPICGPLESEQTGTNRGVVDFETNPEMWPGYYTSYDTPYQDNEYFKVYFATEAFITGVDVVMQIPYDGTTIYYGPITENEDHGDHIHMAYSLYVPKKIEWHGSLPKEDWLDYRTVHLPFDAHVSAGGYLSFGIATDKLLWIYLDYAAANCSIRAYSGYDWGQGWGAAVYDGERMDSHTMWARYYTLANTEHKTKLFEYKRQMYMIQNMSNGTSAPLLYVNGYRGLASDNSTDKTKINTGLTLVANELKGKIALIIDGPGESEMQPWRRITSNTTAGVCTVSRAWKVAHTAATTYVILDTNTWSVVGSHGLTKPVTDVAVVNDMVVFCQGAGAKIRYMNEAISNGTWVRSFKPDATYYADKIQPIVNEEGKLFVWRAIADGAKVDCSPAGVYGDTTPLVFDINKNARAEQQLIYDRANADKTAELAKADNLVTELETLKRTFDDLTREHLRLVEDYADGTANEKEAMAERDEDIYVIKKRLAGSGGTWTLTEISTAPTLTYGDSGTIAHNEMFGTNTALAGSDIAKAVAATAEIDDGYITTLDRIMEDATWQITLTAGHEHSYLPMQLTCGNTDSRITNLVAYGTPTIPYVIKEDSIGSVLNKIYDEIPIPELRAVRSEDNGIAAMAYGVYLYFSMAGTMIERYYDQRLDDVGPNRADGLPRERQGVIRKMIPYPGRYYIAIDGGSNGYSSILCSNELGWHEIYRMPVLGRSITDLWVQTIPGDDNTDRLWVGCENSVFKLPIAINPLNQANYQYYGYGVPNPYITTSWIDYGMKDVNKYFHSVTLFADYPLGNIRTGREFEIIVSYRLSENDAWKLAGTTINDPAFPQEIELDRISHNVSGKKIQLKFEFRINSSASYTPRLKAWVLNGILRMPVKKSWQLTFALEPSEDLQDRKLKQERHLLIDQLNTWANSKVHNTPLIMRTCDRQTDNKLVFIDPASISLINVVLEQNRGNTIKQFDHLASLTVYEV